MQNCSWYTVFMQPNQQSPEEWQQPSPSNPAAPYQAPIEPAAETVTPAIQPTAPVSDQPIAQPAASVGGSTQQPPSEDAPLQEDFQPDGSEQFAQDDDTALLRWEGSEYIHHSRGALWYVVFAIVAIVAGILAIVVLKSITFAILIPVMAAALLVYVRRAPDVLQYTLSRKGLHVNDKLYTYDQFKSFGVVTHGDTHAAVLVPRKRFQIGQTIYFPEEVGEQLVDMLAQRLPMTDITPDAIDRLLAKLHL